MEENKPISRSNRIKINKIAPAVIVDALKTLPACVLTSIETYYEDAEAWNSESRT